MHNDNKNTHQSRFLEAPLVSKRTASLKSPHNALCSKTELTLMICGLLQYADGVAIVFDLSRPETFEGALSWLSDVTQKLFDEKRELAAAEAAHAASSARLNCSAEDSLKVT